MARLALGLGVTAAGGGGGVTGRMMEFLDIASTSFRKTDCCRCRLVVAGGAVVVDLEVKIQ